MAPRQRERSTAPPARRQMLTMLVITAIAAAAVGWLAGWFVHSPAQVAADAAPPALSLTAAVVEGVIQDDLVYPATVTNGTVIELSPEPPAGVASIVTAAPIPVGSTHPPGTVLIEISDRPVIFLRGAVPLIRDLHVGDRGDDVTRLQESLVPWGVTSADGVFGRQTLRALRSLYQTTGYAAPDGALRSELVFAPTDGLRIIGFGGALGSAPVAPLITATGSGPTIVAHVSETAAQGFTVGQAVALGGTSVGGTSRGVVKEIGVLMKTDDGSFDVPVEVTPDAPLAATAVGSAVEVTVLQAPTSTGLLVPVPAVFSDASGGEYVVVERGVKSVRVSVDVIESGGGRARITPSRPDEIGVDDRVVVAAR